MKLSKQAKNKVLTALAVVVTVGWLVLLIGRILLEV